MNHCLIPGSYQMDATATVRTRSQAKRYFSMVRRFGWEACLPSHWRVGASAGGDVVSEEESR